LKKREIEIDSRENVHIQVKGLQKYNISEALYLLVIAEGFEPHTPTLEFIEFRIAYALIINKL